MKIGWAAKIAICMVCLKLLGVIGWAWWIILAPIWGVWIIASVLYFLIGNFIHEDQDDEEV